MKIELTGNPFVDTGIFTIQSHLAQEMKCEIEDVDLTNELVKIAMESSDGFGRWLAKSNRQHKAFMMVCGKNSPLTNSATNKWLDKEKNLGYLDKRDSGWKTYLNTLENLSKELFTDKLSDSLCDSCGQRESSKILKSATREWFPLAGSIGSDAQALPAASRTANICSLCLIAIQWLPLGTCIFNGGLACFQFSEPYLSQSMTQSFYEENRSKLEASSSKDKIFIINSSDEAKSGKHTKSLGLILFEEIIKFNKKIRQNELPKNVTLNIWSFSNSGQSPDCQIYEIPNPSLQFFWEGLEYKTDLEKLLNNENPKKTDSHLLSAIEKRREYLGFYPYKKIKEQKNYEVASIPLFELYQEKVLKRLPIALEGAKTFAKLTHEKLKFEAVSDKKQKKLFNQVLKENPRRIKYNNIRPILLKMLVEFAHEGKIQFEHYVVLFPAANLQGILDLTSEKAQKIWQPYKENEIPKGQAIKRTNKGWDLFWFYFHHAENGTLEINTNELSTEKLSKKELSMFTNPKVKEFAEDLFEMVLEKRGGNDKKKGLDWIEKNILNKFSGQKIKVGDLRSWFSQLAKRKEGYKSEDWDTFCRDEWGNLVVSELIFQTRLTLANLFREQTNLITNK